jgi:hypothetical protein
MARHYVEKEIAWDAKRPEDTVNDNVSKLVFSAEKGETFDCLHEYLYLPELRDITGGWMLDMFEHECPLYMCWVVKYDSSSRVGNLKDEGSLTNHVDGNNKTGDLSAVVYTLHYGKFQI